VPYSMDLLNADGDVVGLINLIKHLEDIMGKSCVKVTQDTLARALMGGNENSGEDMGLLVSNADRIRHELGCVFEFIHHSGKDAARGARGHSSLKAATDTELEVTANSGLHQMKPTKQRDFALGDAFTFKLNQVEIGLDQKGEMVTTCVPKETEGDYQKPDNNRPTPQERFAIQTLEESFRLHQVMPPREVINEPSNRINIGRNVCPVSAWRDIYFSRKMDSGTGQDSVRRTFNRHVENLQVKKIIKVYHEWVWFLEG